MRQAGTLSDETSARRFADFLLTQGISAKVDPAGDNWAVWIYDEAHLERGKRELAEFQVAPEDPKYISAAAEAATMRREQTRKSREAQRNIVDMRGYWDRPAGQIVVTILLIGICIVTYVLTREGRDYDGLAGYLYFAQTFVDDGSLKLPVDGFYSIKQGEIWRLVTPIFMHGSFMHLLFNMMWLYDLGGRIEIRRGPWRLIFLVLITAVISNAAECWMNGPLFLGMSGVDCGLFGYVWMKAKYDPGSGMAMHSSTVFWMLGFLLLCAMGVLGPNIANTAHGVGLAVGALIGIAPRTWRL